MVSPEKTLLGFLVGRKFISSKEAERIARDAEFRASHPFDILEQESTGGELLELLGLAAEFYGIPLWQFPGGKPVIQPEVLALIPQEAAKTYSILPLEKAGTLLKVGVRLPDDAKVASVLRFISERSSLLLQPYLLSRKDFEAGFFLYSKEKEEARPTAYKPPAEAVVAAQAPRRQAMPTLSFEEEGSIIKVVDVILRQAVEGRASDIHIEPEPKRLRIRYRVDGILYHSITLPLEAVTGIVSRIKILAMLRIDETRRPQDGRFRLEVGGRDIDFRIATFPTTFGEKVVIRVLDPLTGLKSITDLGIAGSSLKKLEEAVKKPFGMILMTGPTGSGKTTTQYAILQTLDRDSLNIVTLEDPVEYSIAGIYQSQVRPEIGYDFAIGLRHILRQDPDAIMVGEIRDRETAQLAVHAALTGHIVLSTLHTNNAVGVVPRLLDLGVEPFLLPSALNLMASQRLVRRLCPSCKKSRLLSPDEEKRVRALLENLPQEERARLPSEHLTVFEPVGCIECANKGTRGRVALFEVFMMSSRLADILSQGVTEARLQEEARHQSMVTTQQDGVLKALEGVVNLEEVFEAVGEGLIHKAQ